MTKSSDNKIWSIHLLKKKKGHTFNTLGALPLRCVSVQVGSSYYLKGLCAFQQDCM